MIGTKMTADQYLEEHWKKNRIWTHNTAPHHVRRFAFVSTNLEGEKFLDCGCAFGHSTATLATLHPGVWEGADFSEMGIGEARKTFPAFTFHYAPTFDAIRSLGPYDSTVLSEVLEHVEEDRALVEAVMDVTDRALLITTPCVDVGDPGHVRLYTEDTLSRLFDGYDHKISVEKPFFYAVVTHAR